MESPKPVLDESLESKKAELLQEAREIEISGSFIVNSVSEFLATRDELGRLEASEFDGMIRSLTEFQESLVNHLNNLRVANPSIELEEINRSVSSPDEMLEGGYPWSAGQLHSATEESYSFVRELYGVNESPYHQRERGPEFTMSRIGRMVSRAHVFVGNILGMLKALRDAYVSIDSNPNPESFDGLPDAELIERKNIAGAPVNALNEEIQRRREERFEKLGITTDNTFIVMNDDWGGRDERILKDREEILKHAFIYFGGVIYRSSEFISATEENRSPDMLVEGGNIPAELRNALRAKRKELRKK